MSCLLYTSVIEGLGNSFAWLVNDKKNPTILFAGNNIGNSLNLIEELRSDRR